MTAGLGRALGLAGVGVVAGLALVAALFGTGDLLNRVRGAVAPAEAPRQAADLPADRPAGQAETPAVPGTGAGDQAAIDPRAAPDRAAPGEPRGAAPEGSAQAPSLDLIRVEPTGETVIAGRGAPNAAVEVLRDNQPIARVVADESGQFAIVPPALPPGNSEITLRAVGADGRAIPGRESVAVVVAKERDTQPLVAVSEPDKPTRVLSQPASPAQAGAGKDADKKDADAKPSDAPPQREAAAPGSATKPDGETGKSRDPVKDRGDAAAKPGAPPQREAAKAGGKSEGEPAPVKIVAVDAQEGGRLFVSGQATAWSSLRLYLNDTLVASGRSGADGRIAFTIGRGVKPGGYQIRIDQVESETGKVRNRAQVAFAFPAQLAAKEQTKGQTGEPSGREAVAASPDGSAGGPKPVAERAVPEPSSEGRTARQPAREQPAENPAPRKQAAQEQAGSGPQPAAQERTAREKPVASRETTAPVPQATPSPQAGRKADAASGEPPQRKGGGKITDAKTAAPPSPESGTAGGETKPAAMARQDAPARAAETPPADRPGSVFVAEIATARITRGDNLWQISRRTYGNGRRYTVIYDANQDQIRDPDLIYPGQIFVLPRDEAGSKRG